MESDEGSWMEEFPNRAQKEDGRKQETAGYGITASRQSGRIGKERK